MATNVSARTAPATLNGRRMPNQRRARRRASPRRPKTTSERDARDHRRQHDRQGGDGAQHALAGKRRARLDPGQRQPEHDREQRRGRASRAATDGARSGSPGPRARVPDRRAASATAGRRAAARTAPRRPPPAPRRRCLVFRGGARGRPRRPCEVVLSPRHFRDNPPCVRPRSARPSSTTSLAGMPKNSVGERALRARNTNSARRQRGIFERPVGDEGLAAEEVAGAAAIGGQTLGGGALHDLGNVRRLHEAVAGDDAPEAGVQLDHLDALLVGDRRVR